MTPNRAIKIECKICSHGPCKSKHCALFKAGRPLERIKAHCRDCAPDHRIEECSGKIIGTQAQDYHSLYQILLIDGKAQCPLYSFRYGKNPNARRSLTEKQKKDLIERTQSYRFQKKETLAASV